MNLLFSLPGEAAVVNLLKMRILAEDDELEYIPEISSKDEDLGVDIRPQWMKTLSQSVRNWLNLLPQVSFNLNINVFGKSFLSS